MSWNEPDAISVEDSALYDTCYTCAGHGEVALSYYDEDSALYDTCYTCAGHGEVALSYYDEGKADFIDTGTTMDCPRCNGTGRVPRE